MRRAASSTEAYTLYLKGQYHWNERTEASVSKAIKYFEEAVKVDSNFAAAYSGLADAYHVMADYLWMTPDAAGPLAEKCALKAIALDDGLAEAHASLGSSLLTRYWDFASAESEYRKAIELRPNYPTAYHWYAILLVFQGRFEDASAMVKRAKDLDPYSRVLGVATGVTLHYLRRFDEASEQLEKVIESNPDYAAPHFWKSIVLVELGRFAEAIEEGKKAFEMDRSPGLGVSLAWAYARAGDKESATKILNEVAEEEAVAPSEVGLARFALGEKDEAFRLFRKACDTHDTNLLYLRGSAGFEECQSDPRWTEIEERITSPGPR